MSSEATPLPFPIETLFHPNTPEQLLWWFRTAQEGAHRLRIYGRTAQNCYNPDMALDHLPTMSPEDFVDMCNKTVPFYITPCPKIQLLLMVLHNYVYRRWFRPYKSQLEYDRFLYRVIVPENLPNEDFPSSKTLNSLVSMHESICAEVETLRDDYERRLASNNQEMTAETLFGIPWLRDPKCHVLQTIFQALILVIQGDSYDSEDSSAVSQLPVVMIRTGMEEGLSGPISFESIPQHPDCVVKGVGVGAVKTTLETAISFVIDLEAREAAIFGLQPDPLTSWDSSRQRKVFATDFPDEKELCGPSSTWVDANKHTTWAGDGEKFDSVYMAAKEATAFRYEARRAAGTLHEPRYI